MSEVTNDIWILGAAGRSGRAIAVAVKERPANDLRAGDGYAFLAKVSAIIAQRLLSGEGQPGCFTPGALFGAPLAIEAGGVFVLNEAESKPQR